MSNKNCQLIIGGESIIGRYLNYQLLKNNIDVYYTTRKYTKPFTKSIYLNLNEDININLVPTKVYVCAGISDLKICENNPIETSSINVDATINLIKKFYKLGSHIVFFSSDMVFGKPISIPKINSKKSPLNEYGKQKSIVEEELKSLGGNITIFRMTKITSIYTSFIENWFEKLQNNISIEPYSNYYLSPISLEYVVSNILNDNLSGLIHLSGKEKISYYDFAIKIANKMNFSKKNIHPKKLKRAHKNKSFYNINSNILDMGETTMNFDIKPQSINSVLRDLSKEFLYFKKYH